MTVEDGGYVVKRNRSTSSLFVEDCWKGNKEINEKQIGRP